MQTAKDTEEQVLLITDVNKYPGVLGAAYIYKFDVHGPTVL